MNAPMNRNRPPRNPMSAGECTGCATCCRKGGPALHIQDKTLVEQGHIKLLYLYTIRKGELVYDNVKGRVEPSTGEIIKIRGRRQSQACVFLDSDSNACTIYNHRPLECRTLQCWDSRALEGMYRVGRLVRKDLVRDVAGLWDLVEDHEERCGYRKVKGYQGAGDRETKEEELEKISDIIHYDANIRRLAVEKGNLDAAITDFIFGRPMAETLKLIAVPAEKAAETSSKRTHGSS